MAQDKDQKTLNVPPLRFPGFTDEWKRIKVSDLLDFYSTNSLSWEMLNYEDGDFHNLHYGLIHSGLPTLIDLKRNTLPFVNDTAKPKNYTLCKEGDIAFADASEDTNDVAKAIEFINLEGQQVISGLHTIHGRDNGNKTVVGFKGYAFASSSFHYQIRRIAQGTKIYSISSKSFDEVFISIPNKAEQTKIARLLHLIDERIAAQNKIIDNLQSLIKGLRELLFKPLLSYFVKLGNIAQITNGSGDVQDAVSDYQNGLYPFFDRSDEMKYFRDYSFDAEAIIYAGEGAEFLPRYYNGKFALHQRCYAITTFSSDFLPRYIYHYLQTQNNYFIRNAVGSTVPSLRIDCFLKIGIPIADKEIQDSIINRLDRLSEKINNEKNILSLYQRQKTFLLQKLFI